MGDSSTRGTITFSKFLSQSPLYVVMFLSVLVFYSFGYIACCISKWNFARRSSKYLEEWSAFCDINEDDIHMITENFSICKKAIIISAMKIVPLLIAIPFLIFVIEYHVPIDILLDMKKDDVVMHLLLSIEGLFDVLYILRLDSFFSTVNWGIVIFVFSILLSIQLLYKWIRSNRTMSTPFNLLRIMFVVVIRFIFCLFIDIDVIRKYFPKLVPISSYKQNLSAVFYSKLVNICKEYNFNMDDILVLRDMKLHYYIFGGPVRGYAIIFDTYTLTLHPKYLAAQFAIQLGLVKNNFLLKLSLCDFIAVFSSLVLLLLYFYFRSDKESVNAKAGVAQVTIMAVVLILLPITRLIFLPRLQYGADNFASRVTKNSDVMNAIFYESRKNRHMNFYSIGPYNLENNTASGINRIKPLL